MDWQGDPDAPWAGLSSSWEVAPTVRELTRVATRLVEVGSERADRRAELHLQSARSGLALSLNALFRAADTQCTLANPPSDVLTEPLGPNDDMITRCFHDPSHCWDGMGRKITCP